MRKLLCLTFALFCMILPALAEDPPTAPEWAVGEWEHFLTISGGDLFTGPDSSGANLIITEDGFLTVSGENAPKLPLLYDAEADKWLCQDPEHGQNLQLLRNDSTNYYLCLAADPTHLAFFKHTHLYYEQLPSSYGAVSMAYGGTWQVQKLYIWGDPTDDGFAGSVHLNSDYFDGRILDTPIITLPAFPSLEIIQQAWTEALAQYSGNFPFHAVSDIYGHELLGNRYMDYLLLVTRHGILLLQRKSSPEADPAFLEKLENLVGWWYPDELSVGGIYLPASSMDIPEDPIAIDEQGNVLLPDGTVTALHLEQDTLLLGEYPVSDSLSLTLAENVELDWISENDWYRDQLNGDWQLSRIEVPEIDMDIPVDAALTDVTLNISPYDDWCVMDSDEYLLSESYDDVTKYRLRPLYGDDVFTLTIHNHSTVYVRPESGSYVLTFTRIEETEE